MVIAGRNETSIARAKVTFTRKTRQKIELVWRKQVEITVL